MFMVVTDRTHSPRYFEESDRHKAYGHALVRALHNMLEREVAILCDTLPTWTTVLELVHGRDQVLVYGCELCKIGKCEAHKWIDQ